MRHRYEHGIFRERRWNAFVDSKSYLVGDKTFRYGVAKFIYRLSNGLSNGLPQCVMEILLCFGFRLQIFFLPWEDRGFC